MYKLIFGEDYSISEGVLRNSRNNQWTIGLLSKAFYKVNKELNLSFGLDWRTASVEHYREIRDMLGGDFYIFDGNEFDDPSAHYEKT